MVPPRRLVRRSLLRLARSPAGGFLISQLVAHMSFLLPLDRLRETDTLLAFHHPTPAYPVHILLVPRRPLRRLLDLSPADADFMADLIQTVQSLVAEFDLECVGFRLIVNGGPYQDVPHLHFHLIGGLPSEQ